MYISELNADNSWSAGCSSSLSSNANVTCSSSSSSSSSCSCNTDFCNSLAKSRNALSASRGGGRNNWWIGGGRGNNQGEQGNVTLTLPDRNFVHCEECGSVTVGNQTRQIPCDHDHTCQGNYCVAVRGQTPFSFCGGVWDKEKAPGCYWDDGVTEECLCSMNMCNALLEAAPLVTTTAVTDPTLATLMTIALGEEGGATPALEVPLTTPPSTQEPTTKRKCKNAKLSPNDQAVFMGEKLKNVILGGFGSEDGAVQNFEDDINDHICNYSEDDE
uniref:Activin_recp domain-containing protein n=1 Tax=Caenorhabditis tropicalis TaxID=1561998 RepID=A0A1I7U6A1_9PELO